MDNDPEHTSKSTMDTLKRTQEEENPSKKNLKTVGCYKKRSRLKVLLRDCYVCLFTLYQRLQLLHNTCRPQKFSEDSAIFGCIRKGDEDESRARADAFVTWCEQNYLQVTVATTKELVVDLRKTTDYAQDLLSLWWSVLFSRVNALVPTVKGRSLTCTFITQHRERVVGMLTPGVSTSAVACEVNVHCSITSRLQRCTREFGSASNRPHNHTSPGPRWSETSRPHSCCNSQLE